MHVKTLTACFRVCSHRVEKANAQVITRSRTGNLPPQRAVVEAETTKIVVSGKASAEEIKEKMEQQLRLQRAAHQQKRALELKNPSGQVIKIGSTTQGKSLFIFYFNIIILPLE